MAVRIPAPTATVRDAPASRAKPQMSGAARAPISANGSAAAHATSPKIDRNGTWTIDASGIQCAFEGIGRTGSAGSDAADLGEDPDEVDVEALPRVQVRGDVRVVGRVRVGRVRKVRDEHQPDGEGEPV